MDPETAARLVRQNDQAAQRDLFEAYYRRTFAVVFSILRNRDSAEDITQDAFINAFQKLSRLREPEKFGPWLAVIASNLARNYLQRAKKVVYSDDLSPYEPDNINSTEEAAMRDLQIEQVRRAIRALSPDQQQVITLQFYYDLKIDDIAALLKVNAGTVKSRLFRARQKLSRILEPIIAEDSLLSKGGAWINARKT